MNRIFTILFLMVSFTLSAQEPIDTDGDGYRNISTLEQLRWVSENDSSWSWSFELDNDIDASDTRNWNIGDHDDNPETPDSAMGWSQIGTKNIPYTGTFNGNVNKIDSLFINNPNIHYVGLFGYTDSSEISNLGITNCKIKGHKSVGSLVGFNNSSIISNCYTMGSVSGTNDVGGLVGTNKNSSTISDCYSNVIVRGNQYVGGLAGVNSESKISKAHSSGFVNSGYGYAGGLVGYSMLSEIRNCYSNCEVNGYEYVGGLVGGNEYYSRIFYCYSTGIVSGGTYKSGGLIGINAVSSSVLYCFWDIETSGQSKSAAGAGKSTAEMKAKSTFTDADWDFEFTWNIDGITNDGYPFIDVRESSNPDIPIDTDSNGYRNIYNLSQLRWVSEHKYSWSWNFELDNDIDASDTKNWNEGKGFSPIGTGSYNFSGKFNGRSFSIDNLFINRQQQDYVGFFGRASNEIININLNNFNIKGLDTVGALVGFARSAQIKDCQVNGSVSGDSAVGGICGMIQSVVIENCVSNVNVLGNINVGGIVGLSFKKNEIISCFSDCAISGKNQIGGIIGYAFGYNDYNYCKYCVSKGEISGNNYIGGIFGRASNAYILRCFSSANISGNETIGGLVGYAHKAVLSNCYYHGNITANNNVGSILGLGTSSVAVNNCVWNHEIFPFIENINGIGKTTAEMKRAKTYTDIGWNFKSVWNLDENINDGYPFISIDTIAKTKGIEPIDNDKNGFINISNFEHLIWISENDSSWNLNFELDNNINASSTYYWSPNSNLSPIGIVGKEFSGIFNGNGFTIDSLYIYSPTEVSIGLFGQTEGAEIYKLGLTNTNFNGSYTTGGIAGYISSGTNIHECFVNGIITGNDNVGGIVGRINYSKISNCYSKCYVKGAGNAAGISGEFNKGGIIENCYSVGQYIANTNTGGISAYSNYGKVEYSFWDLEVSNVSTSAGGTGKSTAEMKTKSTFTDAGWDFDKIWFISEDVNGGYPALFGLDNPPTSVTDEMITDDTGITIFPNPASDYIEISLGNHSVNKGLQPLVHGGEIEIYDVLGEKVLHSSTSVPTGHLRQRRTLKIDISHLPKGMYFVRVGAHVQKFVKY